ncbi:MAG: hypothetical protein Q9218_005415 [Villophora microphyllina]
MSVEFDNPSNVRGQTGGNDEHDRRKAKKRKRTEEEDIESPLARKKHRSRNDSLRNESQVLPTKISRPTKPIESSPFHLQTTSLYLPLPPREQNNALQGLCAEHLLPLILTYYPPLRGVILSYRNAKLSTTPQQNLADQEIVLARAIDEYAAPHVWVTAEFLLFQPKKGNVLEGRINLQNEGNIGLVCWNFFNASIEKKRLPRNWKWRAGSSGVKDSRKKLKGSERGNQGDIDPVDASLQVNGVDHLEGCFEDENGRKIEGLKEFTVKDIETSRNSGGDNGFLSIEGTLLSEAEEQKLYASETRQEQSRGRRHQRKENGIVPTMSGALVSLEDEDAAGVIPKKPRHQKPIERA